MRSLNYFLLNKSKNAAPITLDLFEAERYDAAVVVQQLIGNLVYYSNQGRYEPRIAESWQRVSPTQWIFNLKNNFKCENGEVINASNFKKSLEQSIYTMGKKGFLPVFHKLEGYQNFMNNFNLGLNGIEATENSLKFNFKQPVRSGLIQLLSFAPFGYICKDNLKTDGSWKDKAKFISSGAYKMIEVVIGEKYLMKLREDWPIKNSKSPDLVHLRHDLENIGTSELPAIIDSSKPLDSIPKSYAQFPLVPEYLNVVLLGNLNSGYFSNKSNRELFREAVNANRNVVPESWQNHIQTRTFYPTASAIQHKKDSKLDIKDVNQASEIVVEGKAPQPNTPRWLSWQILEATFKQLNLKYRFANNESTWAEMANQNYDLRIRAPSVGGGIEAWGIDVIFCSPIGSNLPDPSHNVRKLIADYENDKIDDNELSTQFLEIIENDAAVIPISRFGIQLYVSDSIKKESLSPLISIIRFDDVELE